MKYIVNPFTFEDEPEALLEGNITSVDFYSLGNQKITVNITNVTEYIDYREPFN